MVNIKLLTLNTHSLVEENYNKKLEIFISAIEKELPDIIALQEVNQTRNEQIISKDELTGFFPCQSDVQIKKDNHAYSVVKKLRDKGIGYYWTWISLKLGYDKYDEGMAILSRKPIVEADVFLTSNIDDYSNWKTRKALGILTEDKSKGWFYTVHFGWWNDADEPFQNQWKKLNAHVANRDLVWLMGDFNSPSQIRNEGYDLVAQSGWHDSYPLANKKDSGVTVEKVIDGWKDKLPHATGMRIDYIWSNKKLPVESSQVIFNGKNQQVVSDHYGVIISV